MRGARDLPHRPITHRGLTPAGAGSTVICSGLRCVARAYPRRCGEHHPAPDTVTVRKGLPPQVRGARSLSYRSGALRMAYPRRCGEHGQFAFLPPAQHGLTPAGAGSTNARQSWPRSTRAYPRRCGEHGGCQVRVPLDTGLPPQVRGALRCSVRPLPSRGLTPAGAGSTSILQFCCGDVQAYPRRCGEHGDRHRVA